MRVKMPPLDRGSIMERIVRDLDAGNTPELTIRELAVLTGWTQRTLENYAYRDKNMATVRRGPTNRIRVQWAEVCRLFPAQTGFVARRPT